MNLYLLSILYFILLSSYILGVDAVGTCEINDGENSTCRIVIISGIAIGVCVLLGVVVRLLSRGSEAKYQSTIVLEQRRPTTVSIIPAEIRRLTRYSPNNTSSLTNVHSFPTTISARQQLEQQVPIQRTEEEVEVLPPPPYSPPPLNNNNNSPSHIVLNIDSNRNQASFLNALDNEVNPPSYNTVPRSDNH